MGRTRCDRFDRQAVDSNVVDRHGGREVNTASTKVTCWKVGDIPKFIMMAIARPKQFGYQCPSVGWPSLPAIDRPGRLAIDVPSDRSATVLIPVGMILDAVSQKLVGALDVAGIRDLGE